MMDTLEIEYGCDWNGKYGVILCIPPSPQPYGCQDTLTGNYIMQLSVFLWVIEFVGLNQYIEINRVTINTKIFIE